MPRRPAKRTAVKTPTDRKPRSVDVYASFAIWKSKSAPTWHGIQKMRYVFWRMMHGRTTTDAVREIHWDHREFWRHAELARDGTHPFREEYEFAKRLQSRALADSVHIIAEGRDRLSRRMQKDIVRMVSKSLRGMPKRDRSRITSMMAQSLSMHRNDIIARNRLQIDAAKWLASKSNPIEFGDKSTIGLGGIGASGAIDETRAITVQFVGPDGMIVDPVEPTGERHAD